MKGGTSIINSWMTLAAAIVSSGIKCNDQLFLQSQWCKELKQTVGEYFLNTQKNAVPSQKRNGTQDLSEEGQ